MHASIANMHSHKTFKPEEAERVAAEMSDGDDWTYKAVHDPSGRGLSFIEVYDEDGEFIEKL